MKKILSVLLFALLALTVLSVTGVFLFCHFVAEQIEIDLAGSSKTVELKKQAK